MSNIHVSIIGTIAKVETRYTKKKDEWYIISILVEGGKQYQVKAFGNAATAFVKSGAVAEDEVEIISFLESNEWESKWYLDLKFQSIRLLTPQIGAGEVQLRQHKEPVPYSDDDLPF